MERLQIEIEINANAETVYQTITDENHYRKWTAVFGPTSHFKGNWEKGAKMHFLAEGKNGELSGLVSVVKDNIPNQFISLEHCGLFQNGEEITEGKEVEAFKGSMENYTITQQENSTLLKIESDTSPEYKESLLKTWSLALNILKTICESQQ